MTLDRWTSGSDYDRWMGRWSRLLAHEFLEWLDAPAGLRWIDLCCGSGMLTEAIAARSPASVVGIDASPQQIEFARGHRASANVTFEISDVMSLRFPNSGFDIAVCGLGLNFLPDPLRALEEFRRVIRPGGTVAAYVWDYEHGARFLREFWDAAVAIDPNAAAIDQARRFPMCAPSELSSLFARAGLEDTSTRALNVETRFTNFEDYWVPILGGQGSAPAYLATLSPESQLKISDRLRAALVTDGAGAIELPARAWAIRGRRA